MREDHAEQLRALEVKHYSMKQATEKHHQIQLELKMSEISSKDDLCLAIHNMLSSHLYLHKWRP